MDENRAWIRDMLIPKLIEDKKLVSCENPGKCIEIQSVEIEEMPVLLFMHSKLYMVKILIEIKNESSEYKNGDDVNASEFNLVVKVRLYRINLYCVFR